MAITISKWGNSAGIRIPAAMLQTAGIAVGDEVLAEVSAEGTIVIRTVRPSKKPKVDIHAMLAQIKPDNLPDAGDFDDAPVGREVW